jgi:hypothetical protein
MLTCVHAVETGSGGVDFCRARRAGKSRAYVRVVREVFVVRGMGRGVDCGREGRGGVSCAEAKKVGRRRFVGAMRLRGALVGAAGGGFRG